HAANRTDLFLRLALDLPDRVGDGEITRPRVAELAEPAQIIDGRAAGHAGCYGRTESFIARARSTTSPRCSSEIGGSGSSSKCQVRLVRVRIGKAVAIRSSGACS